MSALFQNEVVDLLRVIFTHLKTVQQLFLLQGQRLKELVEARVQGEELLEEGQILVRKNHGDSKNLRFSEFHVEIPVVFPLVISG